MGWKMSITENPWNIILPWGLSCLNLKIKWEEHLKNAAGCQGPVWGGETWQAFHPAPQGGAACVQGWLCHGAAMQPWVKLLWKQLCCEKELWDASWSISSSLAQALHLSSGSCSLALAWAILQVSTSWPCTLLTLAHWLGSLAWPPTSLIGGAATVGTGPLAAPPHCRSPAQLSLLRCCGPVSLSARAWLCLPLCHPWLPALVEQLVPDKGCLKNKTTFEPERDVSCISITNLSGGCTTTSTVAFALSFRDALPEMFWAAAILPSPAYFLLQG